MEIKILKRKEFKSRIGEFNELFKEAFGQPLHDQYLSWRYLNSIHEDLLVAVAIDNGRVIANYSVSPITLKLGGRNIKAALSMTTMTHPKYEGQGLFTKLASLLYQEMINLNYDCIIGFPNKNSHGIFIKKLGWRDIYEIPTFTLKINRYKYSDCSNEVFFDNKFEYKFNFNTERNIQVNKTQDYFSWRYKRNPIHKYFNCGIINGEVLTSNIIYKYYKNTIDILEMNGDIEEVRAILDTLVKKFNKENIEAINCWLNINSKLHLELERAGFENNNPITYFSIKELNKEVNFTKYELWDISMGVSDVY